MKRFIIKASTVFFWAIVTGYSVCAQEVTSSPDKPGMKKETQEEVQIAMLKADRSKQIEFRNAFRESLTGNQLDMLTNPVATREERLKSFRTSLTDNQKRMINANSKEVRTQMHKYRNTISEKQRLRIKKMATNKTQQQKATYLRARMQRRINKI